MVAVWADGGSQPEACLIELQEMDEAPFCLKYLPSS